MKINHTDYMEASAFRIETARRLHRIERYSAAIYFAGVSIECLLRSFIVRADPQFDQRHDLRALCKKAQLEDFIRPEDRRQADAWLGDVWTRWKNNYRFASADRIRTEFRRLGHNRGIKGDFLKENSRIAVESAYQLRTLGERRCRSKTN
ncbi:MAG: HEPN domain-containing protein [Verrucomicrobia bacterium]|nr:HEPN domain-containing protein [Verrucomicrobiota bacterium]